MTEELVWPGRVYDDFDNCLDLEKWKRYRSDSLLNAGLEYSNGNWLDVFTHPISGMFLILTLISLVMTFVNNHRAAKKALAQGVENS